MSTNLLIGDSDEQRLLTLARQALDARVTGTHPPEVVCTGILSLRRGAFVSIHSGDELRGCLGRLSTDAPLGKTVVYLGGAVADSDPRFPSVAEYELPSLQIEISLLTPERPVSSIEEITIGRHGVIVEQGRSRGLLLPQVASELGWDRDAFLDHACLKARLPRAAWRTGARILIFEAQVFAERAAAATS